MVWVALGALCVFVTAWLTIHESHVWLVAFLPAVAVTVWLTTRLRGWTLSARQQS